MSYTIDKDDVLQRSNVAIAQEAQRYYRDMINAKLLHTLERMQQPDYQTKTLPDDFFESVLERVRAQRAKR